MKYKYVLLWEIKVLKEQFTVEKISQIEGNYLSKDTFWDVAQRWATDMYCIFF
jgi:hypothetical protein